MSKEDKLIKEQKKRFSDETERFKFFISEKNKYFESFKIPADTILSKLAYERSSANIRNQLGIISIPEQYNTEADLATLASTISADTLNLYNTLIKSTTTSLVLNYPELFTSPDFENFAETTLKPIEINYSKLEELATEYLGKPVSDDFIDDIKGTNLEGLNSIGWIESILETLKYKYTNSKLGAASSDKYSNSKINENIEQSLLLNLSRKAPFKKKQTVVSENTPNSLNLSEQNSEETGKSPLNEQKATPSTSISSTINQEGTATAKPETTTRSSVTSGTIELPKEPVESKESSVINISLENKEKPETSSNTTNIGSPINEKSENNSTNNTNSAVSNTASNINDASVINQGSPKTTNITNVQQSTPSVINEVTKGTQVQQVPAESVNTIKSEAFSAENISKLYKTLNLKQPSTINSVSNSETGAISNSTTAITNPVNETVTNTSANAIKSEAFNPTNVSKLYNALNLNQSTGTNIAQLGDVNKTSSSIKMEGSTVNIPAEPTLNQPEVTKVAPSFSEKIQAAAPIVSPIKKLEETTNISTTEITNAPSKEIVTSSTTSEKTETSAPAPASMGGVSIDLGPLEQRMARIEYLLSNTLEVKLID